jgi:hypothetical protein
MQELPHDDLGRPTQPWANYYQGITDRLARAGFGTTTNDDAAAGTIGEFMTATVAGPGVGIGNNFASNIASLPLTAGDWDVRGEVWFRLGVGPTGDVEAGISQVAGALPANPGQGSRTTQTFTHTANSGQVLALAPCRMSLAAAATVYLVAVCGFSGGSTTAYGRIEGRRIR